MNTTAKKQLSGHYLVKAITASMEDAVAENIVVINLKKLHCATDWFVLCDCDNISHVRACANKIFEDVRAKNGRPWQTEGYEDGRWVILDYSDVVVHVMLTELREYYRLEELWSEGVIKRLSNTREESLSVPLP